MDPDLVTQVIVSIAQQAAGMVGTLTPVGLAMANSFVVLGIISLGAAIFFSPAFILPVSEFCMWAALTMAFVGAWDQVIMGSLDTSNQVLGMFLGGYQGPTDLFNAAGQVAQRLAAEPLGWGLSVEGTIGAGFKSLLMAAVIPITVIGLCIPGILALLAQITLVVGSLAGPLIICGLAFGPTRPMAAGAINFVISATLRVIMLGLVSVLFANAIVAQLAVPGTGEVITVGGITGLLLTACLAAIVGFSANSLAGLLVGGGVAGLGLASFARPAALAQTAATAGAAAATGGAAAIGAGARAGAGAARAAAGVMRSGGSGSAFGG